MILLVSAVFVVFFSFLPHWVAQYPGTADDPWLWSIRVLFIGHVIAWIIFLWVSQGMRVIFRDLPRIEFVIGMLIFPAWGIIAVALEAVISFGHLPRNAAFVYEGALMLFMTLGLYNFVSLLLGSSDRHGA